MKKENKNLNSYLPFSDHCLTPKFLSNDIAVNTFVRLIKESHNTYKDTTLFLSSFVKFVCFFFNPSKLISVGFSLS